MGFALTNSTIDKYFGFLVRLDNKTKKKLIIKLTESIDENRKSNVNLRNLHGAWEDSKDSDEIINEIRNSRIEKSNNYDF